MTRIFRPKGVSVPIEYSIFEWTDDYSPFHPLDTPDEFPLVDVYRNGTLVVPCFQSGDLYEPVEYHLCGPTSADPTFLEDPFAKVKPAYRMRSGTFPWVNAMVLDIEGRWRQTLLKPVLTRIRTRESENAGIGFSGVIPRGKNPHRVTTMIGYDVLDRWKHRDQAVCSIANPHPIRLELSPLGALKRFVRLGGLDRRQLRSLFSRFVWRMRLNQYLKGQSS